jgi:hypothetical protein
MAEGVPGGLAVAELPLLLALRCSSSEACAAAAAAGAAAAWRWGSPCCSCSSRVALLQRFSRDTWRCLRRSGGAVRCEPERGARLQKFTSAAPSERSLERRRGAHHEAAWRGEKAPAGGRAGQPSSLMGLVLLDLRIAPPPSWRGLLANAGLAGRDLEPAFGPLAEAICTGGGGVHCL